MAQLVVRDLEDDVKAKLKELARRNGRSMEEEVREILRDAIKCLGEPRPRLGSRLAGRFAEVGLTDPIPEVRGHPARPADLGS